MRNETEKRNKIDVVKISSLFSREAGGGLQLEAMKLYVILSLYNFKER